MNPYYPNTYGERIAHIDEPTPTMILLPSLP